MRRVIGRITSAGYVSQEASTVFDRDKLDDMLASQQAPGGKTDDSLTRGHGTLAKQFDGDEKMLNVITENLKKQGFTPNRNDAYLPMLARKRFDKQGNYLYDPLAFVPSGMGAEAHIKKVCEMRNVDCDGLVTHKRRETPPTPKIPVAENIVNRTIREILKADPSAAKLGKAGLREKAIRLRARRGTKV